MSDGRTKVLRIIARLNTGGPALHTLILTKYLDPTRFESLLVTGSVQSHEGDMSHLAEDGSIPFIKFGKLGRRIHFSQDFIVFFQILYTIIRFRPCIIHTHTAKAGTLGRLATILYNGFRSRKNRCILIHTYHGHVFHSYFSDRTTKIFIWIERLLGLATYRAITISPQQRKEVGEIYKVLPPEKIRIVRLGIYVDPYLNAESSKGNFRSRFGLTDADFVIGAVGRLTGIKNLPMFLDAASLVIKNMPDKEIYFIVAGDGDMRNKLEIQAIRLDIRESIVFTGWVEDLPSLYADLDILALTSLNEGTPLSVIEAMSSRVPIAATDVGGVRDLLGEREKGDSFDICTHGILVQPEDARGFSEALSFLINNPETADQMGSAGRGFAEATYSHKRLVRDIDNLYCDALESRGKAFRRID